MNSDYWFGGGLKGIAERHGSVSGHVQYQAFDATATLANAFDSSGNCFAVAIPFIRCNVLTCTVLQELAAPRVS